MPARLRVAQFMRIEIDDRDTAIPERFKHKVPRSYSDAANSASSFTELGMTIF